MGRATIIALLLSTVAASAAMAAQQPTAADKNAAAAVAKAAKPALDKTATKKDRAKRAATKLEVKSDEKVAAKKTGPAKSAKHADKTKPQAKKTMAARNKSSETAEAVAQQAPSQKVAAAPKAPVPSYTITTTRNGATYTTTHIVPLAEADAAPTAAKLTAAPAVKVAATPSEAPTTRGPPATAAKLLVASARVTKPAKQPPAETAAPLVAPPRQAVPAVHTFAAPSPAATAAAAEIAVPAAVQATDSGSAAAFVSDFLHEAFRLATVAGTPLQRRAQLAALFARKLDIARIAGYTTADELNALPPEMQQRFRTVLISYLVETYYPRIELAADPSVTVEAVAAPLLPDDTAVVTTTFTKSGWGSEAVKWHLARAKGGYRVIDIMSAGASLVQMERDTFHSVMRDGGVPALMARLDARTKALASAAP